MTVDLPATPGPVEMTVRQIDFGGVLTPGLGGPVQRVNRNGNRFSVSVKLPPMAPQDARHWIAALNRGVTEGVRWRLRQPGFNAGAPGTVLVDGAGQAGASLVVDGVTPNHTFLSGQFVSIVTGSVHHLHMIGQTVSANASGEATLTIVPALRSEPADNDVVTIGQPMVEGLLASQGMEWTIDRARLIGLEFTIVERR